MNEMWVSSSRSTSPSELKKSIARIAQQFSGFGQQDSQELMNFLLDGIHEDLNQVSEKPYKEIEEKKLNETDEEAAKRFWDFHRLRNDSIIVDLFHGQYKSTITCPKCSRVSTTFDPFTTVGIPIPRQQAIDIFFLPYYNIKKTIKMSIFVSKDALFYDINHYISVTLKSKIVGRCMIVDDNKVIELPKPDDNILKGSEKGFIVFCEIDPLDLLQTSSFVSLSIRNTKNEIISLPKMIIVDKKDNGEQLEKSIYKLMRRYVTSSKELDELVAKESIIPYSEHQSNLKTSALVNKIEFEKTIDFEWKTLNTSTDMAIKDYFQKLQSSYKVGLTNRSNQNFIELSFKNFDGIDVFDKTNSFKYELTLQIKENDILTDVGMKALNSCVSIALKNDEKKKVKEVSLNDCLDQFKLTERLDKNNEWYCNVCKEHVRAFKKLEIYHAPKLMILHLKRFEYEAAGKFRTYSQKINNDIEFPIDEGLDMSQYIVSNQESKNLYDLYGVSHHYGSCGGGHYVAACKNSGEWYDFNDSSVRKGSSSSAGGGSAYVLMFRRRD